MGNTRPDRDTVKQDVLETVKVYANNVPQQDATGYKIPDTYLGQLRPVKVLIIGFGAAAINIVHILGQNKQNNVVVQCYEKNAEVGGTWYENRYPGCACDIPAEILGYFKEIVAVHNLDGYVKLNHKVSGAWWDDESGKWRIKVQSTSDPAVNFEDEGDILINATGVLNNWKWPQVPGVEKFKTKVHIANWDDSIELESRVVGIIGNGSSAVQIIPAIFPKVKKLKSFMRSTTWITAGFAQKYAGENGANFNYTEEQKTLFRNNPNEYLKYRKLVEEELNQRF